MYLIINENGEVREPRKKTTQPTPNRAAKTPSSRKFHSKYALNAQGVRQSINTNSVHRLSGQLGPHDPLTSVITENSAVDGDQMIAVQIRDMGYEIGNMLYERDVNTGEPITPPGIPCPWAGTGNDMQDRMTEFNCRRNHCHDQVKYTVGFTDQTDGGSINWIYVQNNVHDAFATLDPWPHVPGQDESRMWSNMTHESYMCLKRGDKIVFKIDVDPIDQTKNWGFGNGVQYINIQIFWMNLMGNRWKNWHVNEYTDNWQFNDVGYDSNVYAFSRVYKRQNTMGMIVGKNTDMQTINAHIDTDLSNTLGYNVFSVQIPLTGYYA
tara:strand:- start:998 stop:1966 length:969 start_codon:yes stop_codon:yes gene_type:complete